MNLYVGNLSTDITEDQLKHFFTTYGTPTGVRLVKDAYSGSSKGFGFLEMKDAEALKAINALNGKSINGKRIIVTEAHSKTNNNKFSGTANTIKSPFGGSNRKW